MPFPVPFISPRRRANKSVIVHGPQGCGKTRHGQQMADHFGLQLVIEAEWSRVNSLPAVGALILSSEPPPALVRHQLTFAQAMKLLEGAPGYPF